MPNWCINTLNISGEESAIKKFKNKARGHTQTYNDIRGSGWPIHDDIRLRSLVSSAPDPGPVVDLSFHSLYPVPEDFRRFPYDDSSARELGDRLGEPRPYGGYQWENIHWGCKWGGCETELVSDVCEPTFLQYNFHTAWGPPSEFVEKISRDWPSLYFELEYEEPGMGFAGSVAFSKGECCHADTWDIEYEEEEEE